MFWQFSIRVLEEFRGSYPVPTQEMHKVPQGSYEAVLDAFRFDKDFIVLHRGLWGSTARFI